MKKLYTLFLLAFLTACGSDTPPVWDGEWKGDPEISNARILIVDFAGESKNVFFDEKGERIDKCKFINYQDAQGSIAKLRCRVMGLASLEIKKDGKMTLTMEDGVEAPGFVWVDPNQELAVINDENVVEFVKANIDRAGSGEPVISELDLTFKGSAPFFMHKPQAALPEPYEYILVMCPSSGTNGAVEGRVKNTSPVMFGFMQSEGDPAFKLMMDSCTVSE